MPTVNIQEAKTQLSKRLERVANGEEIIIAKAGKPIARLAEYQSDDRDRTAGQWQDLTRIGGGGPQLNVPRPFELMADLAT